jgi:crossover junction endodeoxyribonuclease RusA
MKIELFLPFPPSINNYYVKTRNGVFISKEGRAFRSGCLEIISEVCGPICNDLPLDYPLAITLVLYPPDKRKRDLDNYKKALYDAITHSGLWLDDSLIDQEFVYRGCVIPKPDSGKSSGKSSGFVWVCIQPAGPVIPNHSGWREALL